MRYKSLLSLVLFASAPAWSADVPVPVATDSRIKTFVYSENDVFNLVTHFGYQSNIEFPENEQIETISVGDKMGWRMVMSGRRLFIIPTIAHARTNMTIVTTKHAYQFDIIAEPAVYSPNEELSYVVRFFYPDDKKNTIPQAGYADDLPPSPAATAAITESGGNNYKYSFTGDNSVAPLKVYDDGAVTYFKFSASVERPVISSVGSDQKETPLTTRKEGEYWVVDTVASQFTVREGRSAACVFNDNKTMQR